MTDVSDIRAALAEPFAANEVKWKPQSVKSTRALAICYVDARLVMDRLDDVFGPGGWQDEYTPLPNGSVLCRLSVKIGGEWVAKQDVGSESEQPDEHDRTKAAFSDALKRVAVKFGIGRYLYRLGHQWCDYDTQKKKFSQTPQLPAWALPRKKPAADHTPYPERGPDDHPAPAPAKKAPPPSKTVGELWKRMSGRSVPTTGAELLAWLASVDGSLVKLLGQEYTSGGLAESVVLFLKRKVPADLAELKPNELESGWNSAKQYVKGLETAPAKAVAK